MSNFVLSFDPINLTVTADQLQQYVQDCRTIDSWYSPFWGTYLLKSNVSAKDLSNQFRGIFGPTTLFSVTQAWPHLTGGALPPLVWKWFNDVAPPIPTALAPLR